MSEAYKGKAAFIEHCEKFIAKGKTSIVGFRLELQEAVDPLYVLEWSDHVFEAAAVVSVYSYVLRALVAPDSKATLESVRDYAHKKAIEGAKHIKRSVSVVSNLSAAERTAAWANLLEEVEAFI